MAGAFPRQIVTLKKNGVSPEIRVTVGSGNSSRFSIEEWDGTQWQDRDEKPNVTKYVFVEQPEALKGRDFRIFITQESAAPGGPYSAKISVFQRDQAASGGDFPTSDEKTSEYLMQFTV